MVVLLCMSASALQDRGLEDIESRTGFSKFDVTTPAEHNRMWSDTTIQLTDAILLFSILVWIIRRKLRKTGRMMYHGAHVSTQRCHFLICVPSSFWSSRRKHVLRTLPHTKRVQTAPAVWQVGTTRLMLLIKPSLGRLNIPLQDSSKPIAWLLYTKSNF